MIILYSGHFVFYNWFTISEKLGDENGRITIFQFYLLMLTSLSQVHENSWDNKKKGIHFISEHKDVVASEHLC